MLSKEFLKKYENKVPKWGYSGLGFIVFKRTYSREKSDNTSETWIETISRCINGAQEIGADYTKEEAEKLFDYIFNLKCSFAGRMLWMLGTEHVRRWGANALINCHYTSITEYEDFCFLFENLMMGGGVGFSVRREDVHELPKVKENIKVTHENTKDADFIVPDSREGWVYLLRQVLKSYFRSGKSFSYSTILVRGYGEKIKSFGGTASGPAILIDGIEKICKILISREGKKLRSIDVLDICNIISAIVVAGNVRRSATIALGDPDDYLFIRAKRWDLGNIPNWRAMSNNTIYADDFTHIQPDIWEGYNGNGEPYGFFNLPLAQKVGRLGEHKKDNCDGMNPCCTGDTLILTPDGEKTIESFIKNIKKSTEIICEDGKNRKINNIEVNFNIPVYELELENNIKIKVTASHQFFTLKSWNKVEDIIFDKENKIKLFNGEFVKIKNVKAIGNHTVYDLHEPITDTWITNGIISRGCGEINLGNGEVCCLSELFLNNITSKEELIDCARLLYKTQKAICAMNFLHEKTNKIVHKNFRIGISVTGICQSLNKLEWLDECYKNIRDFDKEYSKQKGYPESIKITTIKPSGTCSLLAGATPGVHPAYSQYYIRRIRMGSNDKLIEECKKLGYKIENNKNYDGTIDYNTMIVEFPCYSGENAILAKDMSAVKQLELVKKLQTIWADNSISVTVYYKKEELQEIKKWLKENYKDSIKSVSFLLHQDHGFEQAPYTEITKEQYEDMISKVKSLNSLIINDTNTLDVEECHGGSCPIK